MFRFCLIAVCFLACFVASAQSHVWTHVPDPKGDELMRASRQLEHFETFEADPRALRNMLQFAPKERNTNFGYIVWMPTADGTLQRFRIWEYAMQSPAVARQTGVRTYTGQGVDDPWATAKFDIGINGFHGMVLSPNGTYFIDPMAIGEQVTHIVYYKRDYIRDFEFSCLGAFEFPRVNKPSENFPPLRPGPNRKEYRLAIKGTVEYTAFYGSVANADNGTVTVMNRVNGVYEKDIAIRMNIVQMTNYAVEPDPYTNSNGGAMLSQNQSTCDANPGNANYDIGHVFSTGGGGIAGLQVVGVTGNKARGVTGLPSPIGDPFAIDYVAHEMGHQYGANHTFNGTTGSCGGNRSSSNAYEPGSGSTIMAYAGICGAENLQNFSDDYFHINSMSAIESWRNNAGSGGSTINTGNISPVVNAGADFTIPQDTPFRLTAVASDANGDSLTYCWEQYNLGAATPTADESTRPLFRSFLPTTSPTRWFPRQTTVLTNSSDQWENLPSVNRSMTFRSTVRDNRAGGGNFEWDATVITVSGSAFSVTAPNTNVSWPGNSLQTVTWNVGGGSVAANVRILLSTDGGNSYYNGTATEIVASTPNDGSHQITVPNVNTTQARIFVEAVGNVFYDVSNVNFTITPVTPVIVNPTAYTVVEGSEPVHNLSALLLSDDVRLEVRSNTINSNTSTVEYITTAPAMTVNRVSFILECHANDPARQRNIDLWNYTTGQWETVSTTIGTTSDSTVKVDITSNPGRFINGGNREMRARTRLISAVVPRTWPRVVDFMDRAVWELSN